MNSQDFEFVSQLLRKRAGIVLTGDKMYLLVDGEVSLTAKGKVIATVRKGEVFGEMASISQMPRSASAVVKVPSRVIALDDSQFQSALR